MTRETNYDEVFEAQEHFRTIMDCMAQPGKIQQLEGAIDSLEGFNKVSSLIGFALMDSNTGFYQNYHANLDQYFLLNTSAIPKSPEEADFLFLKGSDSAAEMIEEAKVGIPEYPEGGAFLIIEVETLSKETLDEGIEITLKGPGVKGEISLYVVGLNKEVLEAIQEKNFEYPLGVDTILTDASGNMVCIPRSNQFTF